MEWIEERIADVESIFVMGAGLIGIDVVAGLLPYHKKISIADMGPYMLPIQLDAFAAKTYQDMFAAEGVTQYYEMGAKEFVLDEEGSQIECDRFGLIFDECGRTNVEHVYGAGDVSGRNPIWPVAVKEGMVAAYNMSGVKRTMNDFFASKSTMNFLGLATMSIGNTNKYDESYKEEIFRDEKKKIYKKIVHKDGKITGAILQGDLAYCGILLQLIRNQIDVSKVKKPLFDVDYSDFFRLRDNFEFAYESEE